MEYPDELLCVIFNKISFYDLPKLLSVSKRFNQLIRQLIGYDWYTHAIDEFDLMNIKCNWKKI